MCVCAHACTQVSDPLTVSSVVLGDYFLGRRKWNKIVRMKRKEKVIQEYFCLGSLGAAGLLQLSRSKVTLCTIRATRVEVLVPGVRLLWAEDTVCSWGVP